MNRDELLQFELNRAQRWSLWVGGIALLFSVLGFQLQVEQFFQAYLVAYLFWLGVALGSFAVLMLHHLLGRGWGYIIRRPLEAAVMTIPLMALLFLPLLLGLQELYIWARPAAVAADPLLQAKQSYLNVPFFLIRALGYFIIWILLAYRLVHWSAEQERSDDPSFLLRLRRLSLVGLLLYTITVSFASIDWAMSLDPHWYSSIYGVLFIVGQGVTAFAFVGAILVFLVQHEPLASTITEKHVNDLRHVLLMLILVSAYFAFSQYLVIWSGNFPIEVTWYHRRGQGGWEWLALLLALFYFVAPFLLLMAGKTKRHVRILATLGASVLFMRLVELYWFIGPTRTQAQVRLHWLDLAVIVAIGGLWLALFLWRLKAVPLLPRHDPYIEEAVIRE